MPRKGRPKRKLKPVEVTVHEIVRRHLDSINLLTARQDATTLTPIERDAIANLITDEIVADYNERTAK